MTGHHLELLANPDSNQLRDLCLDEAGTPLRREQVDCRR